MSDLDDLLSHLRDAPPPAGLTAIDAAVMTGLARRREAIEARRGLALAGAIAVVVGIGGALLPGTPASAEPLLGVPSAAPSHLLAE